jgi:hypothetical protein
VKHLSPRRSQQVEEILQVLDHLPTLDNLDNRRSQKRISLRMDIDVTLLASPVLPRTGIVTRNLSVKGLGFIWYREFRKNEFIAIHLVVPGRISRLLLGQVAFCRYIRNGVYEAGAEFQELAKPGTNQIPMEWMQRAQLRAVIGKVPTAKTANA